MNVPKCSNCGHALERRGNPDRNLWRCPQCKLMQIAEGTPAPSRLRTGVNIFRAIVKTQDRIPHEDLEDGSTKWDLEQMVDFLTVINDSLADTLIRIVDEHEALEARVRDLEGR